MKPEPRHLGHADPAGALEVGDLRRRQRIGDDVDVTLLQREDLGVDVGVDLEHDLGQARGSVGGQGIRGHPLHRVALALGDRGQLVGPRAHPVAVVGEVVHLGVLAEDVLGNDGHPEPDLGHDDAVRLLEGELDPSGRDGGRLVEVDHEAVHHATLGVLGLDGVDRVGHVGGGELLAVTPLEVVPDLEVPGLAVLAVAPLRRQVGALGPVGVDAEQPGVHKVGHPAVRTAVAEHGVEVDDVRGRRDVDHVGAATTGAGGTAAARRRGAGRAGRHQGDDRADRRQPSQMNHSGSTHQTHTSSRTRTMLPPTTAEISLSEYPWDTSQPMML